MNLLCFIGLHQFKKQKVLEYKSIDGEKIVYGEKCLKCRANSSKTNNYLQAMGPSIVMEMDLENKMRWAEYLDGSGSIPI